MRWNKRPDYVPSEHFRWLLKRWNDSKDQERARKNAENRAKQTDMHTCGKKSFAMIRENLIQADEEKKEPSNAEMFKATRKRVPGRTYKEASEDIQNKIARMEELQSQQTRESGESSSSVDPFVVVMGKERSGRVRLYGRGVTASSLGKTSTKSNGASVYVPDELLQSIKADVAGQVMAELKTEVTRQVKDHYLTEFCQTMASQLKQLHPQMDLDAEALKRLGMATQSPGDASSAQNHHQRKFGVSSVGTNEVIFLVFSFFFDIGQLHLDY
ncbi:hypothetical protein Dimus_027223 [Dionaea muscipula]